MSKPSKIDLLTLRKIVKFQLIHSHISEIHLIEYSFSPKSQEITVLCDDIINYILSREIGQLRVSFIGRDNVLNVLFFQFKYQLIGNIWGNIDRIY